MIDATKLVDGGLYHVQYHYGVWTVGRWHASNERFTFIGSTTTYSLTELTDAIPIPMPEQLQADAKRLAELERDHAHALAETKRRVPDYPFTQNTMSECVWALGESLIGTEAALRDWQELHKSTPTPETLAEIMAFLADIAQAGVAQDSHGFPVVALPPEIRETARKLLEKRA